MLLHCVEQDLGTLNTLGLPARAMCVSCESETDLQALSELAARHRRLFVLGGGSNVVLAQHISALVVRPAFTGIEVLHDGLDQIIVQAHAAENWHGFVAHCLVRGWHGLENLALIPGTVGAAPVQNIGAYGVELEQRVHSVVAWNIPEKRRVELLAADCGFSYRDSLFKRSAAGQWLILSVRFALSRQWQPVLTYPDLQRHPTIQAAGSGVTPQDVFNSVCSIRRSKLPDPAVVGNVGSFFKNPVIDASTFLAMKARWPGIVAYSQPDGRWKLAAGWMIEQAGWKGYRDGAVGVHERQALVLVNYGGAVAADILELAASIRADIFEKFGVMLEQEPVTVR